MVAGLRILLAEDDPDTRDPVASALRASGHVVECVGDGVRATALLDAESFDLLVTDVRLPGVDGLALFQHARRISPRMEVILMTSFGSVADAVAALKSGARDYLTKPFDLDELTLRVASVAERQALLREVELVRSSLVAGADQPIVGASPVMRKVLDRLTTVAASDAPVLVTGETGTGKELVARRLHDLGARRSKPFIAINCAAFPEALLEAELFGHERGAFTGAAKRRDGRFKAADGGTLLLDEVAEMPLSAQAKLLRVLEEGTFEPLGSNASVRVDVRIVSATHRDLRQRMADGRFREDLFYRLNVVGIHIPPLRERPGDLPLLVQRFLQMYCPPGAPLPNISTRAWQASVELSVPRQCARACPRYPRTPPSSRAGAISISSTCRRTSFGPSPTQHKAPLHRARWPQSSSRLSESIYCACSPSQPANAHGPPNSWGSLGRTSGRSFALTAPSDSDVDE